MSVSIVAPELVFHVHVVFSKEPTESSPCDEEDSTRARDPSIEE
jgi:hypothetical protein